jgi:hypothetical protein
MHQTNSNTERESHLQANPPKSKLVEIRDRTARQNPAGGEKALGYLKVTFLALSVWAIASGQGED